MADSSESSSEALRQSILADARDDAQSLLRQAQEEAQRLLAQSASLGEQERLAQVRAAQAEAARRTALVIARIPIEAGRRRATRVAQILQTIHDEAAHRLLAHEGFAYRQAIIRLATQAACGMTGEELVIRLGPADYALVSAGLADEVRSGSGRAALRLRVVADSTITEGGAIVEDAAGRQIWDDQLPRRLERMWPELGLQLAIRLGLVPNSEVARGAI